MHGRYHLWPCLAEFSGVVQSCFTFSLLFFTEYISPIKSVGFLRQFFIQYHLIEIYKHSLLFINSIIYYIYL